MNNKYIRIMSNLTKLILTAKRRQTNAPEEQLERREFLVTKAKPRFSARV